MDNTPYNDYDKKHEYYYRWYDSTTEYRALEQAHKEVLEEMQRDAVRNVMLANNQWIQQTLGVPSAAFTTSFTYNDDTPPAEPSITNKFRITHPSYDTVTDISGLVYKLSKRDGWPMNLVEALKKDELEVFAGCLGEARYHEGNAPVKAEFEDVIDGHVYDPWYRDISSVGPMHFKQEFHSKYQIGVNDRWNTELLCWVFRTTLEKVPVRLFIHATVDIAHVNRVRVNKHIESLSPYHVYTGTDYNLAPT
jgi:hypothetical protein